MAVSDKWISQTELKQIGAICAALDEAYEAIERQRDVSIPFLEDAEGLLQTLPVFDSNGDTLGHIGFTESGFGLYLDDGLGEGELW